MAKQRVFHSYSIPVRGYSAYGRAKVILETLEPLKGLSEYGYNDNTDSVTIWWYTNEDLG